MKTVKKTWGEELWIVNKSYCGKKLILNKGFRCSLHYHKKKDETFYVIKGKVLMEWDNKKKIMFPSDGIHIRPKCLHHFSGLEDSEIIEFSDHHDDSDSYRKELSGKFNLK